MTLQNCEFEDSTNCFWNATEQGNGLGQSFIDIDGVAYYLSDSIMTLEPTVISIVVSVLYTVITLLRSR